MTPELDPGEAVAAAVRQLGHALVSRKLPANVATVIADRLTAMTAEIEELPVRSKAENFGLRNRIATFIETGDWPAPPPDQSEIEFDVASPIGGNLNPFSVGATYFRDGDEVVGRVSVGRCYEGPPERVHGGIICAIFDEVLGSVFRATGTPSAFTGELTVRFEAPAPIEAALEFRGRQVRREGRKNYMEGEARIAGGERIASAKAVFIDMRPEHFAPQVS